MYILVLPFGRQFSHIHKFLRTFKKGTDDKHFISRALNKSSRGQLKYPTSSASSSNSHKGSLDRKPATLTLHPQTGALYYHREYNLQRSLRILSSPRSARHSRKAKDRDARIPHVHFLVKNALFVKAKRLSDERARPRQGRSPAAAASSSEAEEPEMYSDTPRIFRNILIVLARARARGLSRACGNSVGAYEPGRRWIRQ